MPEVTPPSPKETKNAKREQRLGPKKKRESSPRKNVCAEIEKNKKPQEKKRVRPLSRPGGKKKGDRRRRGT